jgi:hypothetical protein
MASISPHLVSLSQRYECLAQPVDQNRRVRARRPEARQIARAVRFPFIILDERPSSRKYPHAWLGEKGGIG